MLNLRPYKKCDAKVVLSWIKDELTFRRWSADRFENYPITVDELNGYYQQSDYIEGYFPMVAYNEEGVVGHILMRFLDESKKVLRFGFVIVDDSKRGKGYGRQLMEISLKYAKEILHVEKVSIGVFEDNIPAKNCYLAIGFKETGEVVELKAGEYTWNVIEMEM